MKKLILASLIFIILIIIGLLISSHYKLIKFEICIGIFIGAAIACFIIPFIYGYISDIGFLIKIGKKSAIILILLLPFSSFSQDKTYLELDFNGLKNESVKYSIQFRLTLLDESRVISYFIDGEFVNDIIDSEPQNPPIEKEFWSDTIHIEYSEQHSGETFRGSFDIQIFECYGTKIKFYPLEKKINYKKYKIIGISK